MITDKELDIYWSLHCVHKKRN